jgi:hypothetical protein
MTDRDAPMRAKLRRDKDEPSCVQSSTESVDPRRAVPKTDS